MMRFKTEEEFRSEYGEDWRSRIHWNSAGNMDYLFGTELEDIYVNTIKQDNSVNIPNTGRGNRSYWSISPSMLVEEITNKTIKGVTFSKLY